MGAALTTCVDVRKSGREASVLPGYPCQVTDDIAAFTERKLARALEGLPPSTEVLRMPAPLGYRCRCAFTVFEQNERLVYGMWEKSSLVSIGSDVFPIALPAIQQAMAAVISILRESTALRAGLQNAQFVSTWDGTQVVVTFTYDCPMEDRWLEEAESLRATVGLLQVCGRSKNSLLRTPEEVLFTDVVQIPGIPAMTYVRAVDAFAHPSKPGMEVALQWLLRQAETLQGRDLFELYCGMGAHTLPLALSGKFKSITAVELDKRLCEACRANMERNGLTQVRVLQGDAGKLVRKIGDSAVLLVDPPRAGLDPRVVELACRTVSEIIYISCSKESMQKDLARLESTFDIAASAVMDLFPLTHHIETLLLLRRKTL